MNLPVKVNVVWSEEKLGNLPSGASYSTGGEMIKEVIADLDTDFLPIPDCDNYFLGPSTQEKLFCAIEKCLLDNGVKHGYTLGRFGGCDSYGLFKYNGYWIVSFSNEGRNSMKGIFNNARDAVNLFLCKMFDESDKIFDWSALNEKNIF